MEKKYAKGNAVFGGCGLIWTHHIHPELLCAAMFASPAWSGGGSLHASKCAFGSIRNSPLTTEWVQRLVQFKFDLFLSAKFPTMTPPLQQRTRSEIWASLLPHLVALQPQRVLYAHGVAFLDSAWRLGGVRTGLGGVGRGIWAECAQGQAGLGGASGRSVHRAGRGQAWLGGGWAGLGGVWRGWAGPPVD